MKQDSIRTDLGDRHANMVALRDGGAERIAIADIVTDAGTQMRAGIDGDAIADYADAYARGDAMPPVAAIYDGERYILTDGFHRIAAARRAGLAHIPCYVTAGTLRDAILAAAGANARNGLRRTTADKQRAIERLLRDEEWTQRSDTWIADHVNVSPKTVSARRAILVKTREIAESPIRHASDGRIIDTTNIGGNQAQPKRDPISPHVNGKSVYVDPYTDALETIGEWYADQSLEMPESIGDDMVELQDRQLMIRRNGGRWEITPLNSTMIVWGTGLSPADAIADMRKADTLRAEMAARKTTPPPASPATERPMAEDVLADHPGIAEFIAEMGYTMHRIAGRGYQYHRQLKSGWGFGGIHRTLDDALDDLFYAIAQETAHDPVMPTNGENVELSAVPDAIRAEMIERSQRERRRRILRHLTATMRPVAQLQTVSPPNVVLPLMDALTAAIADLEHAIGDMED